jgi:hypothetical protein
LPGAGYRESRGDRQPARQNLIEALELFFESAEADEVASRLSSEECVTSVEVVIGKVVPLPGNPPANPRLSGGGP